MLKILIVDDETPIREWIAFCVRKSSKKYEISGLASNGEEALELFKIQMPDIVFTDIKMPIMDGLELMKQIKLLKPSTDIIVLTCYSDFEYARQAVKYGATEYILKTEIQNVDIIKALEKIESKHVNAYENSEKELSGIQLKREAFIKYLIMQENNVQNLSEKILVEQGIFIKGSSLFAMAVKYTGNVEFIDRISSYSKMTQSSKIDNLLWFSYDKDIFVFLGNIKETPSYLFQLNLLKDFALNMHKNTNCTIGLSQIYHGLKFLSTAINEAVMQANQEFYCGEGSINLIDISKQNPEFIVQLEALKNQLFEAVKLGESDRVLHMTDRILAFMEEWRTNDINYLKKTCSEIIEFVHSKTYNYRNVGMYSIYCIKDEISEAGSFQEIKKILQTKVKEIICMQMHPANSYSNTILKAIDYINSHYSEPIGLSNIALYVHLNPEYFSRLFKEETGKNFNNYLAEIRLDKAINLLKNTDMRVNEIAQSVGYPNLSYFSTIFKKHLGVGPFDYRNKII